MEGKKISSQLEYMSYEEAEKERTFPILVQDKTSVPPAVDPTANK